VHFHLIPKTSSGGVGLKWPAKKGDTAELNELCTQIKGRL
jgi:hypothetical protein